MLDETKYKILHSSYQLFHKLGIRSITMDDIARELGMSKKTLYQHFSDKDEIVKEAIKIHIGIIQKTMLDVKKEAKDAVHEIMTTSERMCEFIRGMNPAAFNDMKKYYPEAMKIFQEHQQTFFVKILTDNLKWGIKEGLYRDDIDLELTAYKRMHEVEMGCSADFFPIKKFNIEYIQVNLLDQFLHGVCTLKGHKLINKYKKIEEN